MKIKREIKVGDWIVTSNDITKGKFQFGIITGVIISYYDVDLENVKISDEQESGTTKFNLWRVLNKKELDGLLKLKNKIGCIEGLR